MKRYIKPELNIETINLETSIALSDTMNHINNYDNNGTKVTWGDLFD